MKVEINIDEQKLAEGIIDELKRRNLVGRDHKVTVAYNNEPDDLLYTVKETSKYLKTSKGLVYELIKKRLLPALKLGSYNIRRVALLEFLEVHEGKGFSELDDIKKLQNV